MEVIGMNEDDVKEDVVTQDEAGVATPEETSDETGDENETTT